MMCYRYKPKISTGNSHTKREDGTTAVPFTVKSVFSVSPPTLFELVCLINSDI